MIIVMITHVICQANKGSQNQPPSPPPNSLARAIIVCSHYYYAQYSQQSDNIFTLYGAYKRREIRKVSG